MSKHKIHWYRSGTTNGMDDFQRRVEAYSIPEPNSGCLLWAGPIDTYGYGQLRIARRLRLVHRVVWEEANGAIPKGVCVCHRCDVRGCVELRHLFLGTHAVNMGDMKAKGRHVARRGTANGRAILAEDDVRNIRADPRPLSLIAKLYGVSRSTIDDIKQARKWRHVA